MPRPGFSPALPLSIEGKESHKGSREVIFGMPSGFAIMLIKKFSMKRQEHLAEVEEVAIRVRVENLKNGRYLGTSPDVPGLVAEGRSVAETLEIAQGLARKIVESCREHGAPLPPVFRGKNRSKREFRAPVSVS
jgi:antitoxin HicB